MGLLDQIWDQSSEVIASWGHRYLLEIVVSLVFLTIVHFVIYPVIIRRSTAAREAATLSVVPPPPPAPSNTTIITGPIITYGPNGGVIIGGTNPSNGSENKK